MTLTIFGFSFFFQAEDGIRDIGVTGVQTCALPIWRPGSPGGSAVRTAAGSRRSSARPVAVAVAAAGAADRRGGPPPSSANRGPARPTCRDRKRGVEGKRVELGGRRIIKKKKRRIHE